MDTTKPIDIRYIVSQLAPGAEFHWKGVDYGTYADIGEWRSPDIPKPTEVEVYTAWDEYIAKQERLKAEEQALQTLLGLLGSATLNASVDELNPDQIRAVLKILLIKSGGLSPAGKIKPLNEWRNT